MSVSKILKMSAEWCGPCRVLKQNLANFTRVPVEEINVEENQEAVTKYKIRNIPVLIYLDESGNELERTVGLQTLDQINSIIDKYEAN